jgi:hypothetical protein
MLSDVPQLLLRTYENKDKPVETLLDTVQKLETAYIAYTDATTETAVDVWFSIGDNKQLLARAHTVPTFLGMLLAIRLIKELR